MVRAHPRKFCKEKGEVAGFIQICPDPPFSGALAQLGERLPCTQEVSGSIPLGSTNFLLRNLAMAQLGERLPAPGGRAGVAFDFERNVAPPAWLHHRPPHNSHYLIGSAVISHHHATR